MLPHWPSGVFLLQSQKNSPSAMRGCPIFQYLRLFTSEFLVVFPSLLGILRCLFKQSIRRFREGTLQ